MYNSIDYNNIGDFGAQLLGEMLQKNKILQFLSLGNLYSNNIIYLIECLKLFCDLRALRSLLSWNNL